MIGFCLYYGAPKTRVVGGGGSGVSRRSGEGFKISIFILLFRQKVLCCEIIAQIIFSSRHGSDSSSIRRHDIRRQDGSKTKFYCFHLYDVDDNYCCWLYLASFLLAFVHSHPESLQGAHKFGRFVAQGDGRTGEAAEQVVVREDGMQKRQRQSISQQEWVIAQQLSWHILHTNWRFARCTRYIARRVLLSQPKVTDHNVINIQLHSHVRFNETQKPTSDYKCQRLW